MKFAAAAKTAVIALLALVLFVPVTMIQGLIAERQARRNEAVAGIAQGWGRRQTLAGPYISPRSSCGCRRTPSSGASAPR